MKRILVTGGNGQLAANLKVLAKDHKQTIVMDFKSAKEMDITNAASVLKAFAEKKYDYCTVRMGSNSTFISAISKMALAKSYQLATPSLL